MNKMSYEAPLKVIVRLKNKIFSAVKEQEIFMADFPLMTDHGTFIINGIERVIVPTARPIFRSILHFKRDQGQEFLWSKDHSFPRRMDRDRIRSRRRIYVRIDRKRKFPVDVAFSRAWS